MSFGRHRLRARLWYRDSLPSAAIDSFDNTGFIETMPGSTQAKAALGRQSDIGPRRIFGALSTRRSHKLHICQQLRFTGPPRTEATICRSHFTSPSGHRRAIMPPVFVTFLHIDHKAALHISVLSVSCQLGHGHQGLEFEDQF